MSTVALSKDLKDIELGLDSIYLDPNNPRFVGEGWIYIPDSEIASDAVQENTRLRLIKEFGVDKLRMNMEVNGYLPIDRVIVREFEESQYVVLEGNRRICSAKTIHQFASDGATIAPEILETFQRIPCLQYTGSEKDASWIFQGLRHISGINDWSSFNKAKLLVEQMEGEELNLTEVGKRFGLTPHGAGQWVRGYFAFKQASEESDYINEVDKRSYPYFQELFSRSSANVREWLEWDENDKQFKNLINFNEFVSWLYPRDIEDAEGLEETSDQLGEWERRAFRRGNDIRLLAFLLRDDKTAFEKFRSEKDIQKAYSEAITKKYEKEAKESYDPGKEVFKVIVECTNALDNVPVRILKDEDSHNSLLESITRLEAAIETIKIY